MPRHITINTFFTVHDDAILNFDRYNRHSRFFSAVVARDTTGGVLVWAGYKIFLLYDEKRLLYHFFRVTSFSTL